MTTVCRDDTFGDVIVPQSSTIVSALQVIWQCESQRSTTRKVITLIQELLNASSVTELLGRLYLMGCPFSALAQVLRATGVYGSALATGRWHPRSLVLWRNGALGG